MTVSQIPHSHKIHTSTQPFQLPQEFINTFKDKTPPFGFNGLGELVYLRTYSRTKQNGAKEKWYETVNRVVNGTFNMQKNWTLSHYLPWDETNALQSAKEMYTRIFDMKFLPPGRGLWAMGSPLTEDRKLFAALNNCAFVTTEDLASDPAKPFLFLMDASMLGVGVGFDTKGAESVVIKGPNNSLPTATYQIPDSREGWVKSVQLQLESYFQHTNRYVFDYSLVRAAGLPIRGFGGISSGPGSLMALHEGLATVLDASVGHKMSSTTIVDIMNLIGKCVVSGNLRRTAEIAFGEADDEEYINLKNYEKNPHRLEFGWTSNNSVFAKVGMDYSKFTKLIVNNGEPGFAWLDNMQKYDRMDGVVTNTDIRAKGGNPCLEQTLESYEMCCLVETFPHRHESYEDYEKSLKSAFLYAKTVTLGQTHWPETNQILCRNRRIGTSMSGVAQFISQRGMDELRKWCENGYTFLKQYDTTISEQFAIPRSIKSTSIKPSGTVSLLAGATPGVHYPISRFYLRRVRMAKDSDLLPPLQKAGYHVEPAVGNESTTAVVSFPVDSGEGIRKLNDVSMWEQLSLAAFLQRYWADNQVSCTVTFDPETEGPQLSHALDIFQYQLKGISFLPKFAASVYPQMPYEEIDETTFNTLAKKLSPIDWTGSKTDSQMERFCDSDVCSLPV